MAVSSARIIEQRPDAAPRRVTILGSTGSVGCNTALVTGSVGAVIWYWVPRRPFEVKSWASRIAGVRLQ